MLLFLPLFCSKLSSLYTTLLIANSHRIGASGHIARLLFFLRITTRVILAIFLYWHTIRRHTTCALLTRTGSCSCLCIFTVISSIATSGHSSYQTFLYSHIAFLAPFCHHRRRSFPWNQCRLGTLRHIERIPEPSAPCSLYACLTSLPVAPYPVI